VPPKPRSDYVFKDLSELKEFIIWAKSNQVNALKVGDVEIHFHPMAHVTDTGAISLEDATLTPEQQAQAQKKEELDLLFHSAT